MYLWKHNKSICYVLFYFTYIYLKNIETEKDLPPHTCSLPQMTTTARICPTKARRQRNPALPVDDRIPITWTITVASQGVQQQEAGMGSRAKNQIKPRHSDLICGSPKWHHICHGKHLPWYIFSFLDESLSFLEW